MTEFDRLYIGGEWRQAASSERIEVRSPADGSYVGSTVRAAAADVDAAVAAARVAFDRGAWPRMPVSDRLAVLARMRDHIGERQDELDQLGTRENGVTVAVRPALRALELFDYTLRAAATYPFEH